MSKSVANLKQCERSAGEKRVRAQREVERQRVLGRVANDTEVKRKRTRVALQSGRRFKV